MRNILHANKTRNVPTPPTAPNIQQPTPSAMPATTKMRTQRNYLLAQVDWMRSRHIDQTALTITTTLTGTQYTQLLTYMQALRDVPTNSPNPASPVWPTAPSFIPSTMSTVPTIPG